MGSSFPATTTSSPWGLMATETESGLDEGVESCVLHIIGDFQDVDLIAASLGYAYRIGGTATGAVAPVAGRLMLMDGLELSQVVEQLAGKVNSLLPEAIDAWNRLHTRRIDILLHRRPSAAVSFFRVSLSAVHALSSCCIELEITL